MMTHEEALSKIQKLLRLAQSTNANEAASAAAAAQSLMDKFHIERCTAEADTATVEEKDEDILDFSKTPEGELDGEGKNRSTWRTSLAAVIAKHNACRVFLSQRIRDGKVISTVEIVGRPSDVATSRYLFGWLKGEVERLALAAGRGMGKTWGLNFRLGCIDTLSKKMDEARKATMNEARAAVTGTALVRVDAALARFENRAATVQAWMDTRLNLRKGPSVKVRTDYGARQAGRDAAQSITLGGARARLGAGAKQLG